METELTKLEITALEKVISRLQEILLDKEAEELQLKPLKEKLESLRRELK